MMIIAETERFYWNASCFPVVGACTGRPLFFLPELFFRGRLDSFLPDLTLLVGFEIRRSDLAFGERVRWDTNYALDREDCRHE
jgi:hypothetical protein